MRTCATSRLRPCRYIANTSIAALPESFGSLSNLHDLCVRRGTCARGCGTCAPVHVGVGRDVAGCGAARDRTRVCYVMGSALQGDREHADRHAARVVRRPVQSPLTVRPPGTCARGCGPCASGALLSPAGAAAGCGAARDRTRVCDVVTSAAQDDLEHFDRRAARVVRPPVPAHLFVRAPATCVRGCASGALEHIGVGRAVAGCSAARDRMRVCDVVGWARRMIENTPIAALPESFGSLSELTSLCVRRAPARGCGTCAPMRLGFNSSARDRLCVALVRRRGFGLAGRSRTLPSPRCPSRSPACPSSPHCASAGHQRAWVRHLRICVLGSRRHVIVWRVRCLGFGRAGGSRTRRSPRCPSRLPACRS
jgi:hypothetical protein